MINNRILYFILPIVAIIIVILIEMINDSNNIPIIDFSILYIVKIITVLVSLYSIFSSFTRFKNRPRSIMLWLFASSLLVIIDYYLSIGQDGSDNLLWLLPMTILVYAIKGKAILSKE